MKRTAMIIVIVVVGLMILAAVWFAVYEQYRAETEDDESAPRATSGQVPSDGSAPSGGSAQADTSTRPDVPPVDVPLDRAGLRVTKKPFGIYIDPATSPVQPERFRGYHTGADFEILPGETDSLVSVRAVCPGTIAVKEHASGYGGAVVERCTLGGGPVTVVYGHLALGSVATAVGNRIGTGEVIGSLGAAGSTDTDGERKHLHLGIHKGTSIDILGYVSDKRALSGWLDPCMFFCR